MDVDGDPSRPQGRSAVKKCLSAMLAVRVALDADLEKHKLGLPDDLLKVYSDFVSIMEGDLGCVRELVCPRRADMSFASSYGRDLLESSLLNQTLEEVPDPVDMFAHLEQNQPTPSETVADSTEPDPATFNEYRRRESDSSVYFSAEDLSDDDDDAILPPPIQPSAVHCTESAILPIGDAVPSLDDTDDSHVSVHSTFDEAYLQKVKNTAKIEERTSLSSDIVEMDENDRGPSTAKPTPVPNADNEYIETPPPSPVPEKATANDTMESLAGALGSMKLNNSLNSNSSFYRSASPSGKENCLSGFMAKRDSVTSKTAHSRIPQPSTKKQPFGVRH